MIKSNSNIIRRFCFKGTFRSYQARVLENAAMHLEDNHIHIVAAPGSGKTILGLELICRIGEPALVLSPTLSIRNQWKQRFTESFIDDENIDDLVSTSLKNTRFITSITYQTLYSAYNKLKSANVKRASDGSSPAEENNSSDNETLNYWDDLCDTDDYNDFEILRVINEAGIKTICLDEAHHLRAEWQRALEDFLSKLDKDFKVIALTATPPYDSNKAEWDKYISICGEIDDEIFVPELVKAGNLCYHQDYVYFNYPSRLELDIIEEFNQKVDGFISLLLNAGVIHRLARENLVFQDPDKYLDICFDDEDNFIGFLKLLEASSETIPPEIRALFLNYGSNIPLDTGFQFIYNHEDLFPQDLYKTVVTNLRDAKLIERNTVRITSDRKISSLTLQSVGKLESIREICNAEFDSMGSGLRMLILSDYIRKNYLSDIGTNNPFTQIGIIPIFESVRRSLGVRSKLGVLTGSLIILPVITLPDIERLAVLRDCRLNLSPLVEGYVIVTSNCSNLVSLITEAFQMGYIEILIGTKSLLGEGWDSPNINSLILASFVGSFVLSNQMRGRAIRIDPRNINKSANIWHLITIEPPKLFKNKLMSSVENLDGSLVFQSDDYLTLERRFKTFVGPHYSSPSIENGIKRVDIIRPPFDKNSIDRINQTSLKMAVYREEMKAKWKTALGENNYKDRLDYEMQKHVEINKNKNTEIVFKNHLYSIFTALCVLSYAALFRFVFRYTFIDNPLLTFGGFLFATSYIGSIAKKKIFLSGISSHKKRLKAQAEAILKTFINMGEIKSSDVKVLVQGKASEDNITVSLSGGTIHEKEIFAASLREIAAPIQRQKYLLVYKSKKEIETYLLAVPCPELIGKKREYVEYLQKEFKKKHLPYDIIHTRNAEGRDVLLKVRKLSLKSLDTALAVCVERFVLKS